MKEANATSPQVEAEHYRAGYDTAQRWSSYWIQIEQALKVGRGNLLEVGVGNSLVADYLRSVGERHVTTVDIDPLLSPDITADITDLPFADDSFACAMACEVLEHLPWEKTEIALRELNRVSQRAIISVPNSGKCIQITVSVGQRFKKFLLPLTWLPKRKSVRIKNQHYWELGISGYPSARFEDAISRAGWNIEHVIRNPMNLFHQFYVLRKRPGSHESLKNE